jgi:hypothetical protein
MATKQKRMTTLDEARDAVTQILDGIDKLFNLKSEWDNGLSSQIVDATGADTNAVGYAANDFAGMEGLRKLDFNQVFGTSSAALLALVISADGKKMQDIRK